MIVTIVLSIAFSVVGNVFLYWIVDFMADAGFGFWQRIDATLQNSDMKYRLFKRMNDCVNS